MGLRGSGKTTIGSRLAGGLGIDLIDIDVEALRELGHTTVAAAWDALGVPAFRHAERVALERALAAPPPAIIALGGGTPTAPGAAEVLAEAQRRGDAIVIYLHADATTLASRLAPNDDNRPSLTGEDPAAEMGRIYTERNALYRGLAGAVVDVTCDEHAAMHRTVLAVADLLTPRG